MKKYKLIFTVPEEYTETVLQAIGDAGAGIIWEYTHCSYVIKWSWRFIPWNNAHPAIWQRWQYEKVSEDQVQVDIDEDKIFQIMKALKETHPYEQIVYDIFEKLTFE